MKLITLLLLIGLFSPQEYDPGEAVLPPPGQEMQCQNRCHKEHCDQWVQCNEIPDEGMQLACKRETNKTEERCRSRCNLG